MSDHKEAMDSLESKASLAYKVRKVCKDCRAKDQWVEKERKVSWVTKDN